MIHTTVDKIVSHKILNEDTGEVETRDFKEIQKRKKVKGGFNMIYHKSYEEVMEQSIKSNKDLKLFNWITNQFTYKKSIAPLIYSECKIDISQPTFSKMIKKLLDLGYIKRKGRGLYLLNPFIYLPFKADAEELQKEWNENNI